MTVTEGEHDLPTHLADAPAQDEQDSDRDDEFSDSISFAAEFHLTPLDPAVLLMDELKHEDTAIRVNAIAHLAQICEALGAERTRAELLPFLLDSCDDEDDEVMLAMAVELPRLVPLVGGAGHAHLLVGVLGRLAGEEDQDVRAAAIGSLVSLGALFAEESFGRAVFDAVASLQEHVWFTRKQSAVLIAARLFASFEREQQRQLARMVLALLDQDATVVRRCVAENLPAIIGQLPDDLVDWRDVAQAVVRIARDGADGVRLFAVHCVAALAGRPALAGDLVPLLVDLLRDESWRVKYVLCERYAGLFAYFRHAPFAAMDYVDHFVRLCADPEAEVRASAVAALPAVVERIAGAHPADFVALVSPIVLLFSTSLCTDPSVRVRTEFARVVSDVCRLLGGSLVDKFDLLALYRQLLNDASDVRLVLLQNLAALHQSVGIERISAVVVDALGTLSADAQWRVRMSLVQFVPTVAEYMGAAFFDGSLSPLLLRALGDHVWSVREAALDALARLVASFGSQWAAGTVQGYLKFLASHPNYLFRGTAVAAAERVAHLVGRPVVDGCILPAIARLLDDPVPNVRLAACRGLGSMRGAIAQSPDYAGLGERLAEIAGSDADADVRHFARESAAKMKQ